MEYFELNRRRGLLGIPFIQMVKPGETKTIYCVSMHLLNDDELVWQRQLVLASLSTLHVCIETQLKDSCSETQEQIHIRF